MKTQPIVTSPYIIVRSSRIHHKGVFARMDIPKKTKIIEYVGEKISKKESERRADEVIERAKADKNHGAVYIFDLNRRRDIDGNVPYNTAKYINHSCHPNCEIHDLYGHIWIVALRDIRKGEEISYDYGYDYESYEDHPCLCGTEVCVGYIVAKKHRARIRRKKYQKSRNNV
ncbi:MAG: SET domain-containing protein-lysine N-methyltransferase [Rectinemataceae bacterium]|nr:SET domain-containing protein-lysine N-methyltransferase [Rectinemataceae bacterium]